MTTSILLKDMLRSWFRGRGFVVILLAALIPPLLTSAWVFTHQADVGVTEVTVSDAGIGENLTATAVIENLADRPADAFNATIRIGYFTQVGADLRFTELASHEQRIGPMPIDGTATISVEWTAQGGSFIALADVDTDDILAEIEERNNQRYQQFFIEFPQVELDIDPLGQLSDRPGANATADLVVESVTMDPDPVFKDNTTQVTITVRNDGPDEARNASMQFQVYRAIGDSFSPTPFPSDQRTINLTAGEVRTFTFDWNPTTIGNYAILGVIVPGPQTNEGDSANNVIEKDTVVDREFLYEEPEPKATAKDFYRDVLAVLHLKLLIPLIALWYAGGVLEDEKEKGNLDYLLTRPIRRETLPALRFGLTVVVAGAAILVGIIATFLLLLGLPQEAPGFLYWPLLVSLLGLVVYGALFTLLGVWVQRPYLVGLLYVLGLETAIVIGRNVLVNGRPLLQDWVTWFSLNHWMDQILAGWTPDKAWQWLPDGDEAVRALWVVLAVTVASLAGAFVQIRKREFA